jgi:hypothetical protein
MSHLNDFLRVLSLVAATAMLAPLGGCALDTDPLPRPEVSGARGLLVSPDDRATVLARLDREPYAGILAKIRDRAAQPYEEPDAIAWDHSTIGRNNVAAQANALLAWLLDDETAAAKARDFLLRMPTDFETNTTWDVNIRIPGVLMTGCQAWDLLRQTPWLSDEDAMAIRDKLTTINGKFYDAYIDNGVNRQLILGFAQNNHPVRTAAAIGMVAITFPDHPRANDWANWAVSELSYILGDTVGRYLQPDGGVSEGPFYYAFAFGAAVSMLIAMDNAVDPNRAFARDCRNRQSSDPWLVTDCVEGEPFLFDNPLRSELLHATLDWSINLRMPNGYRAPLADANFEVHNGGALLTSFGGGAHLNWDLYNTRMPESQMTWGMDLLAHHLVYVDDSVGSEEPPWHNRFLPDAGNAVFRTGWQNDDMWLLLVAENGATRKTLHDHVDGTSFSLAAYGEYLLLDPGYYKPNELDNALTADGGSHNTILIDGQGAPDKGLLAEFGDTDAFLRNTVDGDRLAYAEAHQSYESTDIERSVVFVDQRYFVVADRLSTSHTAPRRHSWRLGGWAGLDIGGVFEPWDCSASACGVRFERELAGVDVHLASTATGLRVEEPAHEALMPPHVGAFDRDRTVADHGVIDGVVDALAPGYLAVLAPYRVDATSGASDAPLTVTAVDAGADASAWLVETSSGSQLVWLRKTSATTTLTIPAGAIPASVTVESDAELTIVDLAGAFALIARGNEARIDGGSVVQSGGKAVASSP